MLQTMGSSCERTMSKCVIGQAMGWSCERAMLECATG